MAERPPGTPTPLRMVRDEAAGYCHPETGACALPLPEPAEADSGSDPDPEPPADVARAGRG
jgi:hypothetical protein